MIYSNYLADILVCTLICLTFVVTAFHVTFGIIIVYREKQINNFRVGTKSRISSLTLKKNLRIPSSKIALYRVIM